MIRLDDISLGYGTDLRIYTNCNGGRFDRGILTCSRFHAILLSTACTRFSTIIIYKLLTAFQLHEALRFSSADFPQAPLRSAKSVFW